MKAAAPAGAVVSAAAGSLTRRQKQLGATVRDACRADRQKEDFGWLSTFGGRHSLRDRVAVTIGRRPQGHRPLAHAF